MQLLETDVVEAHAMAVNKIGLLLSIHVANKDSWCDVSTTGVISHETDKTPNIEMSPQLHVLLCYMFIQNSLHIHQSLHKGFTHHNKHQ